MKIAIISDTHDNLANFLKVINWLNKEKIQIVLHCGDVCRKETLEEILKNFKGEIRLVSGNADLDLENLPEIGEVEIEGNRIAFTHYPEIAEKLAETRKYDLVFYGHDHRPWEKKVGNCRLINPGNVAGVFYKATFAVYNTETDKLELKILEKL